MPSNKHKNRLLVLTLHLRNSAPHQKHVCFFVCLVLGFFGPKHRQLQRHSLWGLTGKAVHRLEVSGGNCSHSFQPLQLATHSHTCIPTSGTFILRSLYLRSSSGTSAEFSFWGRRGRSWSGEIFPTLSSSVLSHP